MPPSPANALAALRHQPLFCRGRRGFCSRRIRVSVALLVEETSVRTRRDVLLATVGLALTAGARRARAQDGYPERPIRILVGYPAGGGVDIVARLFAEPMKA